MVVDGYQSAIFTLYVSFVDLPHTLLSLEISMFLLSSIIEIQPC